MSSKGRMSRREKVLEDLQDESTDALGQRYEQMRSNEQNLKMNENQDDEYYALSLLGDPDLEGPLAKCGLCRQIVSHSAVSCPYLYYVPHNVSLPRGYERACKGCGKKDGHPGREWDGYAVLKYCLGCFEAGDHWADDPDCPKKKQTPFVSKQQNEQDDR